MVRKKKQKVVIPPSMFQVIEERLNQFGWQIENCKASIQRGEQYLKEETERLNKLETDQKDLRAFFEQLKGLCDG